MKKMRRLRNKYRALPKGYYHFCTDGWKDGLLFNNEYQYVSAMTSLAIMTIKFNIVIYGFALMPNHVHVLLSGTGEACLKAFYLLIHRCARRLRLDGYPLLPDTYWFKLVPVENQESFRSHSLYIARNPYEKGLSNPGGYLWGSDYLFYNDWAGVIRGTRVNELTCRNLWEQLDCRDKLPTDWEIHPRLGILARNFVKTDMAYKLFPTSKSYMTRLVKDYETYVHVSDQLGEELTLSDTEIRDILYAQSAKLFPGKTHKQMTPDEKIRLAVTIVNHFHVPVQKVSSFLYISEYTINQALHSKAYGVRGKR